MFDYKYLEEVSWKIIICIFKMSMFERNFYGLDIYKLKSVIYIMGV